MNLTLVLFGIVLAVILAHANHAALGLLVGAVALAGLVIVPWIENAISAQRIERRPGKRPGPTRRPGRRR